MGIDRRRYLMMNSQQRNIAEEKAEAWILRGSSTYHYSNSLDAGSTFQGVGSVAKTSAYPETLAIAADGQAYAMEQTKTGTKIAMYVPGSSRTKFTAVNGANKFLCTSAYSQYLFLGANNGTSAVTGYSTTVYKIPNGIGSTPVAKKTFNTWDQASTKAACSENGQFVCIGGMPGYTNGFVSRDYGETWTETLATSSYGNGANAVDMSCNGQYTLVGSQGGLNISKDSLQSFTHLNNSNVDAVAVSGDGSVMYYDVSGTGFYRSSDYGTTWEKVGTLSGFSKIVCSNSGQIVLAIGNTSHNLFKSSDYGKTWATIISSGDVLNVLLNKWKKVV